MFFLCWTALTRSSNCLLHDPTFILSRSVTFPAFHKSPLSYHWCIIVIVNHASIIMSLWGLWLEVTRPWCCICYAVSNVVTWDIVRQATSSDETLKNVSSLVHEGFPSDCRELSLELRPYHRISSSAYCAVGIIIMGQRIIIPSSLRPSILEALHAAHQDISAMCARAAAKHHYGYIPN